MSNSLGSPCFTFTNKVSVPGVGTFNTAPFMTYTISKAISLSKIEFNIFRYHETSGVVVSICLEGSFKGAERAERLCEMRLANGEPDFVEAVTLDVDERIVGAELIVRNHFPTSYRFLVARLPSI